MNAWKSLSRPVVHAGLLLALASLATTTRATAADDAERASIAAERAAIDARYAARERECLQRFVVTSCVDDAKRERRIGLDALKARQLALDEARRRARTAERSAEIAAKAADDAKRERTARPAAASAPASRLDVPHAVAPNDAASAGKRPTGSRGHGRPAGAAAAKASQGESAEARQANEARNRAAFESRQREAAAHRDEVLDNTTRRMTEKPPAHSLPVPSPTSAASR
jgi:colicin import membrane protein